VDSGYGYVNFKITAPGWRPFRVLLESALALASALASASASE
jgi:hypothetical protein